MAWTTPPTFAAGTVLTAAQLNILSDDLVYLKAQTDAIAFSGVQVTRGASTGQASGSWGATSFTSESVDVGGWWSSGTAVVVPAGAIPSGYTSIMVTANARGLFAADATGRRGIRIAKNGSATGAATTAAINGDSTYLTFTDVFEVVAGDNIALELFQNSGSTLNHSDVQLTVYRVGVLA